LDAPDVVSWMRHLTAGDVKFAPVGSLAEPNAPSWSAGETNSNATRAASG